jgi:4-amino-4-deoxy-L-arabinose transferase-like glycosyltransferase
VDSIYIEVAREMMLRHDYVTPYIDGIRFFDKPPLMYWMAAGSMHLFGMHDWAARLPLALCVLALLLATYALGNRLYRAPLRPTPDAQRPGDAHQHPLSKPSTGPRNTASLGLLDTAQQPAPDRAGFYAALVLATAIGPYLYTRFFIPDIVLALWMTLAVHLFLIARDRIAQGRSTLYPMLGFGAVMAANVLTKGLIGVVFPVGFVLLYLALTGSLRQLLRLHLPASTALFFLLAAPWHILAAVRNPPIALPPGLELPARGGWAWFYLVNEHLMRFLGRRVPHDYGQVPVPLFWLLLLLWMMPWAVFLPGAIAYYMRALRQRLQSTASEVVAASASAHDKFASATSPLSTAAPSPLKESAGLLQGPAETTRHARLNRALAAEPTGLTLFLWALIVLGFFTLSSRQEYYSLPAIPALALLAGGLLASADWSLRSSATNQANPQPAPAARSANRWSLWLLVPLATLAAAACGYYAIFAPHPPSGADVSSLMAQNPDLYNLSLGHIFDLTGAAMGFFRGPLTIVALAMLVVGPIAYLLRRSGRTYAANLALAGGMTATLLAAHAGLTRFYPILGSKGLAEAILNAQRFAPRRTSTSHDIRLNGTLTIHESDGPSKPDEPKKDSSAPGTASHSSDAATGNNSPANANPVATELDQPRFEPDLSGRLTPVGDLIILDGELTSGSSLIFYTQQPVHLVDGRINGPWYGSFWPDAPPIFETDASLLRLWAGPRRIFLLTYNAAKRIKDLSPAAPVHVVAAAGGKTILSNR